MYSIDIEIEQLYSWLGSQEDLVREINNTALILDKAGAPKEERYQKVLDFTKKITSEHKEVRSSYGLLYYILVHVFGLPQHVFQVVKTSSATIFPGVKEYRNLGIREYNSYCREITDKKIQDRLDSNLDTYITSKDKKTALLLDLEYLEKYRKVNCMKVAREVILESNLGDDTALNNSENKKAYELALSNLLKGNNDG